MFGKLILNETNLWIIYLCRMDILLLECLVKPIHYLKDTLVWRFFHKFLISMRNQGLRFGPIAVLEIYEEDQWFKSWFRPTKFWNIDLMVCVFAQIFGDLWIINNSSFTPWPRLAFRAPQFGKLESGFFTWKPSLYISKQMFQQVSWVYQDSCGIKR